MLGIRTFFMRIGKRIAAHEKFMPNRLEKGPLNKKAARRIQCDPQSGLLKTEYRFTIGRKTPQRAGPFAFLWPVPRSDASSE